MRTAALALVALAVTAAPSSGARTAAAPTLQQLVGQHLLIRMQGSAPSAALLARIRRGEVGGIVLFQTNIPRTGVQVLVAKLQSAARAGGQPPLLIAIDQEGGIVKRLPGPPTVAPSAMTSNSTAFAQGVATGRYLRQLGIGLDLAPVLDVPSSAKAFILPRAFSGSASMVSARGVSFAKGLVHGGAAATAKHFPGLGRLGRSTDDGTGRVDASRAELDRDLTPFRAAVRAGIPAVMVGTAIYRAYDSRLPAACSPAIVTGLLRQRLGFHGVILSDDLDTAGVWSSLPTGRAVVDAVRAGVDMVYVAGVHGSPTVSGDAYSALLQAAREGLVSTAQLQASYDRVVQLKQRYQP